MGRTLGVVVGVAAAIAAALYLAGDQGDISAGTDTGKVRVATEVSATRPGPAAESPPAHASPANGKAGTDPAASRPVAERREATPPAREVAASIPPKAVVSETAVATPPVPATAVPGTSAAAEGEPRRKLTRAIQTELRRVGCYAGEPDGTWGPATQQAMKAFNDRINASLPVIKPDYILLTLLQGEGPAVCSRRCPPGQSAGAGGVCQPAAVTAGAQTPKHPSGSGTGRPAPLQRDGTAVAPKDGAEPKPDTAAEAVRRQQIAAAQRIEAERIEAERAERLRARERARIEVEKAEAAQAEALRRRLVAAETERAKLLEDRRAAVELEQRARNAERASRVAMVTPRPAPEAQARPAGWQASGPAASTVVSGLISTAPTARPEPVERPSAVSFTDSPLPARLGTRPPGAAPLAIERPQPRRVASQSKARRHARVVRDRPAPRYVQRGVMPPLFFLGRLSRYDRPERLPRTKFRTSIFARLNTLVP